MPEDDAVAALVEQLRIQNAILLQLVAEQSRANLIAMDEDVSAASSRDELSERIHWNAIGLAKRVNLEAVDRVAEVTR